MNLACPECSTVYRVDPDRVPEQGIGGRCRECGTTFRVERGLGGDEAGEVVTAPRLDPAATAPAAAAAEPASPEGETPDEGPQRDEAGEPESPVETADTAPAGAPAFGPQDPDTRARRLARALVSDIKVYHPDKWEASAEAGTLRSDFRDEILKSWEEYVEQVGEEMAKKTPYFRDALNQILAEGDRVF